MSDLIKGDAISKQFISDAIMQKISDLNAQGEKAIPIAREFIRFKKFIDGITPIRADAVQVVRCKDCVHKVVTQNGEYNPEDIVCDYWSTDGLEETDFCSYGERKSDETD